MRVSESWPLEVEAFIQTYGREQVGREVPVGWRRRRLRTPGRCYEAAGRWALLPEDVTYTEGVAIHHSGDDRFCHAWLTDASGQVIDLAWSKPGKVYHGVQIPRLTLAEVLASRWGHVLPTLVARGWRPEDDPPST